jgi:prepilin-type N-terminal cleavage/methylation domain-containing protein
VKARAFSLIELSLVLLIIAIAAAAVTLRVQGPMGHARMRDAVDAIGQFDRTTRQAARAQDRPLWLTVDLAAGTIRRVTDSGREADGAVLSLPDGFAMERLLVRGQETGDSARALTCSRSGLVPTYALLLRGGGERRWLVVAGLTGELLEVAGEGEARELVAATGPGRYAR